MDGCLGCINISVRLHTEKQPEMEKSKLRHFSSPENYKMQGSNVRLTMIWCVVTQRLVHHSGRARIDGLQSTGELAPEQIFRGVEVIGEHARGEVLNQGVVSVLALELRLEQMTMRVDEAWADDLVSAIYDSSTGGRVNIGGDLGDEVALDQKVADDGDDVVLVVVEQEGAILE